MNRIEIEKKLNEDRAWLLETYSHLTEDQLFGDLTPSEHDPSNFWSALDHLAHLALIERNFAAMIRRHISGHKNPVGLTTDDSGAPRTRDQIMASVHAMTEEWQKPEGTEVGDGELDYVGQEGEEKEKVSSRGSAITADTTAIG